MIMIMTMMRGLIIIRFISFIGVLATAKVYFRQKY
jgi:hypothetical protein